MKHIEALIDDGGEITVGPIANIECVATAVDGHNTLAMLARRNGEMLGALLERLVKAIAKHYETDEATDEINPPRK